MNKKVKLFLNYISCGRCFSEFSRRISEERERSISLQKMSEERKFDRLRSMRISEVKKLKDRDLLYIKIQQLVYCNLDKNPPPANTKFGQKMREWIFCLEKEAKEIEEGKNPFASGSKVPTCNLEIKSIYPIMEAKNKVK